MANHPYRDQPERLDVWDEVSVVLAEDLASDAERRYQEDPEFCALVNLLESYADQLALTPWELKQAAYLAALHRELECILKEVNASKL